MGLRGEGFQKTGVAVSLVDGAMTIEEVAIISSVSRLLPKHLRSDSSEEKTHE